MTKPQNQTDTVDLSNEATKTAKISKQEEEELSKAYIQKLLKQENIYTEDTANSDNDYYYNSSQEDDYSSKKKKKQKRIKKINDDKKQKYGEINEQGFRFGQYTPQEEKDFLCALSLFGRNWKQISVFIKTRDVPSVKSKAQQYFVKLFRDKKPLPEKVLESGEGYTLSGKPLDPESASAKKYIHTESNTAQKIKKSPNASKKIENKKEDIEQEQFGFQYREKSQYSISKLRSKPKKIKNQDFGDDSYVLIKCSSYSTAEINNGPKQPFEVYVSNFVLGFMDVHSHMFKENEVIGLLGGKCNNDTKTINIETCYPARSTSHNEDSHLSVELDPISEVEIRDKAHREGYKILGWYHSHPKFRPDPSVVDLEYQLRYQRLAKNNEQEATPFVGCIISAYSSHLKGPESEINWFYFDSNKSAYEMDSDELHENAKKLKVTKVYTNEIHKTVVNEWFNFLKTLKHEPDIVEFNNAWSFQCNFKDKIMTSVSEKLSEDRTQETINSENHQKASETPNEQDAHKLTIENVMEITKDLLSSLSKDLSNH